jgi:hypothetical protein
MKAEDFAAWLLAISGMSEGQRREAMAALEKASGVGGAAAASAKKGGKRSRREDALGTTGVERVAAQGCPHCAAREVVGWGRSHGLLRFRWQELRTHLQCADQDADGASAQEGEMAGSRARDDRGQKPGEDRSAVRRPSDDGLPLAPSVSARPCKRQAAKLERDRRSGRNLHPRILQGPLVRPAEKGLESAAERPGMQAFIKTTFPSLSPATGRARPSTRSCLRSTALRWKQRSPGSSRRAIISSATAARRSPLSLAKPGFRSMARTRAGKADPQGASPAHQQRQRRPRPSQAVAQPLQRRRHQDPAQLSWLATRPRSLGRPTRPANLDQRRHRKRSIPTAYDIRANFFDPSSSLGDMRFRLGCCRFRSRQFALDGPLHLRTILLAISVYGKRLSKDFPAPPLSRVHI